MQLSASENTSHPGGASIVLATVNARYSHPALGLRWLYANLGSSRENAVLREFAPGLLATQIVEDLIAGNPRLVGLGVYIWNVGLLTETARILKAVRPNIVLVVGGPEASYEYEGTDLFAVADYLVRGEGEEAFAELAHAILAGRPPANKVVGPARPDLSRLVLPYDAYTDEDLAQRFIYVESSRGCPFRCEFCLSSLEPGVREFPLEPFLAALSRLLDRGARKIRFVDRTFNLRQERVTALLDFLLNHWREGLQVHLEIVPDLLTRETLELMARFPMGGLHLEAGVQSLNPEVLAAVSRRQNLDATLENLGFLRTQTGALLHLDLIAGLPGETWESFAGAFDRLIALQPRELQVGILKRLKGAPIARHTGSHGLVFAPDAPYEILQTGLLDFTQMQRIKRFARYFDLYYNSGNFPRSLPLLWNTRASAFDAFMSLSDSLYAATGKTHQLSLARLADHLYEHLARHAPGVATAAAETIALDYGRLPGRRDRLSFQR